MRLSLRQALSLLAGLGFALAAGTAAAAGSDEALALVPTDAASVGIVRLDALRANPLAARLFAETDDIATHGDAAKFMEETGLRPKQDVDLVVVAGLQPHESRAGMKGLVLFEGRFDPARLEAAMESRGAVRKRSPHGDYLSLEGRHQSGGQPAAVAFVSRRLLIAGSPAAVLRALADRAAGGSGFLRGEGIGRHLPRVPGDASAWAMVDATRYPLASGRSHGSRNGDAAAALVGAMKSVSLFVFHATGRGDSVELSATGLSPDGETRELLEDALRGVVAMWRLAVHEKSPDLVPILRKFDIERDDEGVTISGTLPGSVVRKLVAERQARAD